MSFFQSLYTLVSSSHTSDIPFTSRDVPAPTPKRGRSRRNSIAREDSEENAMASTSRTGTPATRHTRSRSTASVKSPLVKPEEDDAPRTRARSRSRARSVSRADEASVISAKMRSKAGYVNVHLFLISFLIFPLGPLRGTRRTDP